MFLSYSVVKPHMVAGEKERWKKWQSKKSLSGANVDVNCTRKESYLLNQPVSQDLH